MITEPDVDIKSMNSKTNNSNMNTSQNNKTLWFLSGAILGAAAVYYAQTPAGQKLKDEIVSKGADLAQGMQESVKKAINQSGEIIDDLQQRADNLTTTAQSAVSTASDKITESIATAKQSVHNGTKA